MSCANNNFFKSYNHDGRIHVAKTLDVTIQQTTAPVFKNLLKMVF